MGRDAVNCTGLGDLVVGELLEVCVAFEVELINVNQIAVEIEHLPVGDCLGLGLEGLRDNLALAKPY